MPALVSFRSTLIATMLLFSQIAGAAEPSSAAPSSQSGGCGHFSTATDLVRCALLSSPQSRILKVTESAQEQAVAVAKQRPNPQVAAEFVPLGNGQRTEITAVHTFQLGGKRSSRIAAAEATRDVALSEVRISQEDLVIDTVKDLYFLRQKLEEEKLLAESSEAFANVVKTYRRRLRLSPEQNVSLSVFQIAAEENILRLSRIEQERETALNALAVRLGIDPKAITPAILPALKRDWPAVQLPAIQNARARAIEASQRQVTAALEVAKAERWPDLAVGPKLEIENSNGVSDTRIGIALSLPLPLYHRNGAGAAFAAAQVQQLSATNALSQLTLNNDRENWLRIYRTSGESISKSLKTTNLQQRHKDLHSLISQGLIGAPEIIELHRQMFAYQEAVHEQELRGVEAQWRLLAMDGKLLEGELK
jgi:outer membrane protein, heavy metal efflux system